MLFIFSFFLSSNLLIAYLPVVIVCRSCLINWKNTHNNNDSQTRFLEYCELMCIENGHNDITNKSSITNGKYINNWRIKRCTADENDADDDVENNVNGNGINGYAMENGSHRSYFKRSSHFDTNKYPMRMNGLRKSSAYFQENGGGVGGGGGGTRSDFHDIYENSTRQHSQFR